MSVGSIPVQFTVGNVGEPGAPILRVDAVVELGRTLTGHGTITQAIEGPWSDVDLPHITGEIIDGPIVGFQEVKLAGSFTVPPSDIVYAFAATLQLQGNWSGSGEFTYGPHSGSGPVSPLVEATA